MFQEVQYVCLSIYGVTIFFGHFCISVSILSNNLFFFFSVQSKVDSMFHLRKKCHKLSK